MSLETAHRMLPESEQLTDTFGKVFQRYADIPPSASEIRQLLRDDEELLAKVSAFASELVVAVVSRLVLFPNASVSAMGIRAWIGMGRKDFRYISAVTITECLNGLDQLPPWQLSELPSDEIYTNASRFPKEPMLILFDPESLKGAAHLFGLLLISPDFIEMCKINPIGALVRITMIAALVADYTRGNSDDTSVQRASAYAAEIIIHAQRQNPEYQPDHMIAHYTQSFPNGLASLPDDLLPPVSRLPVLQ